MQWIRKGIVTPIGSRVLWKELEPRILKTRTYDIFKDSLLPGYSYFGNLMSRSFRRPLCYHHRHVNCQASPTQVGHILHQLTILKLADHKSMVFDSHGSNIHILHNFFEGRSSHEFDQYFSPENVSRMSHGGFLGSGWACFLFIWFKYFVQTPPGCIFHTGSRSIRTHISNFLRCYLLPYPVLCSKLSASWRKPVHYERMEGG